MQNILLYVESEMDKQIIQNILIAAQYPIERMAIEVAGSKFNVIKFATNRAKSPIQNIIVAAFVDADTVYVQEAIEQNKIRFNRVNVEVFFAIPTLESWVFADDVLLKKQIPSQFQRDAARMPLPEEIFYPKQLLSNWLKNKNAKSLGETYRFLTQMDITRAVTRCPSLSYFLQRVGVLLELPSNLVQPVENALADALPKRIFANLLKEVALPNTVVFRTLSGNHITVDELKKAVLQEDAIGKEYIGRVLRVARDIIKNQAKQL
ncbi:MAG: hypothetical protein RLZZ628_692 [Bacteroidota bacterium]|jgi:hypothetical protein